MTHPKTWIAVGVLGLVAAVIWIIGTIVSALVQAMQDLAVWVTQGVYDLAVWVQHEWKPILGAFAGGVYLILLIIFWRYITHKIEGRYYSREHGWRPYGRLLYGLVLTATVLLFAPVAYGLGFSAAGATVIAGGWLVFTGGWLVVTYFKQILLGAALLFGLFLLVSLLVFIYTPPSDREKRRS